MRSRVTPKAAAHFLQGAGASAVQAEAQLQHQTLAVAERVKHTLDLLFQQPVRTRGVGGGQRAAVFDEVGQVGVFFFADGRFE